MFDWLPSLEDIGSWFDSSDIGASNVEVGVPDFSIDYAPSPDIGIQPDLTVGDFSIPEFDFSLPDVAEVAIPQPELNIPDFSYQPVTEFGTELLGDMNIGASIDSATEPSFWDEILSPKMLIPALGMAGKFAMGIGQARQQEKLAKQQLERQKMQDDLAKAKMLFEIDKAMLAAKYKGTGGGGGGGGGSNSAAVSALMTGANNVNSALQNFANSYIGAVRGGI